MTSSIHAKHHGIRTAFPLARLIGGLAAVLLGVLPVTGNPSLPAIFGDHMVLQRGKPAPVWGQAQPGEAITVRFAGQVLQTTANAQGSWRVLLEPMEASADSRALEIEGHSLLVLRDVLVGEVWLASGQSNMQWGIAASSDPENEIANSDHPRLRMINVSRQTAREPQSDLEGRWQVSRPDTSAQFSAVGYSFARHLIQELDVPVGIIHTSWGGTRVEAWTSEGTLRTTPDAAAILQSWDLQRRAWDQGEIARQLLEHQQRSTWENQSAKILFENIGRRSGGAQEQRLPNPPGQQQDPASSHHHYSSLYNRMIHPLVGYSVRGAIWYQGESNASRAWQYRSLMPAMIKDWRTLWGEEFPFIQVQLAGYRPENGAPQSAEQWLELQEAQFLTTRTTPNVGMAVTHDIGDPIDIHPKNKQEVGRRLALWALHHTYDKKEVVPSGPVFSGMEITGAGLELSFEHAAGLRPLAADQPLAGFEIAGEDKIWHAAGATITGERVVLTSEAVQAPVAARYAWNSYPEGVNLVNGAGLPASSFRTDDWPRITRHQMTP